MTYNTVYFEFSEIQCLYLENPPNGSVYVNGSTPGSIATYTCIDYFVLVGAASRVCQDNGQWSGNTPECLRKTKSSKIKFFGTVIDSSYGIHEQLAGVPVLKILFMVPSYKVVTPQGPGVITNVIQDSS